MSVLREYWAGTGRVGSGCVGFLVRDESVGLRHISKLSETDRTPFDAPQTYTPLRNEKRQRITDGNEAVRSPLPDRAPRSQYLRRLQAEAAKDGRRQLLLQRIGKHLPDSALIWVGVIVQIGLAGVAQAALVFFISFSRDWPQRGERLQWFLTLWGICSVFIGAKAFLRATRENY
jgi:hypothetical protein